jgi:hypothetical protein
MKTVQENIYASSNAAVKFCEVFICLTYTQHEIKKQEAKVSDQYS